MIDLKTLADTQTERYVELAQNDSANDPKTSPIILKIEVGSVIPLLLVDDSVIAKTNKISITNEEITDLNTIPVLKDSEYFGKFNTERFVFFCSCLSGMSDNLVMLFYDRKYSDILVIPDTRGFNNADSMFIRDIVIPVVGNVIRLATTDTTPKTLNAKLINNNAAGSGEIPETNENVITTTLLSTLDGNDNDPKQRKAKINQLYTDLNFEIFRSELYPINLFRLGKASDIFKEPKDLPVNVVFQQSYEKHRFISVGTIDTKDRDIYFALHF